MASGTIAVALLTAFVAGGLRPDTLAAQVPGQDHADSVHFRNQCRQAAQTIRTGEPHARVPEALTQLQSCGQQERQLLIDYWRDGLLAPQVSDDQRLERTSALLGLQDRRLYEMSLEIAQRDDLSVEQRTIAMVVLIAQLDPRSVFEVARLRQASPSHYCGGPRSAEHLAVTVGEAIPPGAAAAVEALMLSIVQSAGRSSPIGSAAACVRLTAHVLAEGTTP